MPWRVHLLGDVRLVGGDRTLTRFESRKVVALLARLALRPDRLHPREELAALLWPEADRRTGLERLRHILSSLQRQLEAPGAGTPNESLLQIDRQGVRLNRAAVTCDAVEFEAKVRRHRYAEARALYIGDLLPGHYDDWIEEERERLRALYETIGALEAEDETTPEPPADVMAASRILLPGYLTAFFGRESEREQLRVLLRERRLVTLFGPGGCGKTRLAVEACRDAAADFDTVVFVPLVDCVDPARIPDSLRAALHLPAGGSPLDQIAVTLDGVRALLILDNLEQMEAADTAEAIEALLARLPQVRCLATSRRLLHVPGEQAFPLTPLPIPEETADGHSPGLALFIDRARLARPDFTVGKHGLADLTTLCRLLDGIPLALELAASRIRTYTVAEMRRQIEEEGRRRFPLATRPDALARKDPRHGSLYAALSWSWRLLSFRQQSFLAALSVLRGRWDAGTAATVCGEPNAATLLEELVASSLVIAHESDGGDRTRFSLMETVRAFAAETLSPERKRELRRANAAHALARARCVATEDASLSEEDLTPLQGALEDAIADGEAEEALSLCANYGEIWSGIGNVDTALSLVRRACALPGGTAQSRAEALEVGSYLAIEALNLTLGEELAAEAETAAIEAGTVSAAAAARLATGYVAYRRRDPPETVRRVLEEAVALAREAERPLLEASGLILLGLLANRYGDFDAAEARLQEAQSWLQALGRRQRANRLGVNLGIVASDRGDFAVAVVRYEASLRAAQAMGDSVMEARLWCNLGAVHARREDWAQSIVALQECVRRARALGNGLLLATALWNLAEPLAYTGRGAEAVPLLAFAERFWTRGGSPISDEDVAYRDRVYAEALPSLPDRDLAPGIAKGQALSLTEAVAIALQ